MYFVSFAVTMLCLALQATVMVENAQVRHTSGPAIATHSALHTDLLTFSGLTRWLKECEPSRFGEVMEVRISLIFQFLCYVSSHCLLGICSQFQACL